MFGQGLLLGLLEDLLGCFFVAGCGEEGFGGALLFDHGFVEVHDILLPDSELVFHAPGCLLTLLGQGRDNVQFTAGEGPIERGDVEEAEDPDDLKG